MFISYLHRALDQLAVYCPHIEQLNLNKCKAVTVQGCETIATHFPFLKALSLAENPNVEDEAIRHIARCCRQLDTLLIKFVYCTYQRLSLTHPAATARLPPIAYLLCCTTSET